MSQVTFKEIVTIKEMVTFKEIVGVARTKNSYNFKKFVEDNTNNYALILSLDSWYCAFTKKCPRCENKTIVKNDFQKIKYYCEKCRIQFSYFYKDLDEDYLENKFMDMLLMQ